MSMIDDFTNHVSELLGECLIEHGPVGQKSLEKSVLVEELDVTGNVKVHSLLDAVISEGVHVGS